MNPLELIIKNKILIISIIKKYKSIIQENFINFDKFGKDRIDLTKFITDGQKINIFEIYKDIINLLRNKHDKEYLVNFLHKKDNNCDWNYHTNAYYIAEILLVSYEGRLIMGQNNLGLPNEIWGIIYDYIENDINFLIPRSINPNCTIEIFLNNTKCFFLTKIFTKKGKCIIDPDQITNFINVGDIIIYYVYSHTDNHVISLMTRFSIIVDIDKKTKLITLISDSNTVLQKISWRHRREKYYRNVTYTKNRLLKLHFNKPNISEIFNYHDLIFTNGEKSRTRAFVHKIYLNFP